MFHMLRMVTWLLTIAIEVVACIFLTRLAMPSETVLCLGDFVLSLILYLILSPSLGIIVVALEAFTIGCFLVWEAASSQWTLTGGASTVIAYAIFVGLLFVAWFQVMLLKKKFKKPAMQTVPAQAER